MSTLDCITDLYKGVHVGACRNELTTLPSQLRVISYISDPLDNDRVDWVFLLHHRGCLHNLADAIACSTFNVEQVLHVRRLALVLPTLRVDIAFTVRGTRQDRLLLLIHQLVLVKEAD